MKREVYVIASSEEAVLSDLNCLLKFPTKEAAIDFIRDKLDSDRQLTCSVYKIVPVEVACSIEKELAR